MTCRCTLNAQNRITSSHDASEFRSEYARFESSRVVDFLDRFFHVILSFCNIMPFYKCKIQIRLIWLPEKLYII